MPKPCIGEEAAQVPVFNSPVVALQMVLGEQATIVQEEQVEDIRGQLEMAAPHTVMVAKVVPLEVMFRPVVRMYFHREVEVED